MDNIRKLLDEEIEREITAIKSLDVKERGSAITRVTNLYNLRIEEDKAKIDYTAKQDQLADQVKDRYFRYGLEAVGIILPLICYGIWMKKGFQFEQNGTYTSTTFRGLFNRFKPTAK